MTDHYGPHQPPAPYRGYQPGTFPVDPDRTQVIGYRTPAWATPAPRVANGRSRGRIIAAVVAVLAVAGIATAITLGGRGPAQASTAPNNVGQVTQAPDNGGSAQGPAPIAGQTNSIIAAAMAWMDARNAGDGNRVLQLGCQDDVDAVNAGQPNPAVLSGSSTVRPTGNIVPFGTHDLAAYVESSQVDLHDGHIGTSRLPIIWENGNWHICYYPGTRTQAIAALG